MFQKQTHRYVDVLPDLVSNYNNRPHRSLRNRTPASVGPNEPLLWKFMYIDNLKPKSEKTKHVKATLQHYKYKVGDHVRITHLKHPFQRDYNEKWTEEVFVIRNRQQREGIPIYKLKDWNGEEINGTFYQPELQKVNKSNDNLWRIEKVLKKRNKGGKTELFVKWYGWPMKFNSWVVQDQLQKL